ncbi:hypothetical protein BIW11_04995 [Tropilaelaps mercedesae]|uniref:Uncharacterized protein n=1 Tax=Tropilaelaps mercedesae TaxID=418985 RepID=A0A1V9WYW2_9ACAR|nr:hypothetical protein BIW11_04995 [Tropilaelaps mercedesae]
MNRGLFRSPRRVVADSDDATRASTLAFTDAPYHKDHNIHDRSESKHTHRESIGQLEMIIDPVEPRGPHKIERKVHHEETEGHHHKVGRARIHTHTLDQRPHHIQHHSETQHHSRDYHAEDHTHEVAMNKHGVPVIETLHGHQHSPMERRTTTEPATIRLPSEEDILRLTGEDASNRAALDNDKNASVRPANHEVRHHDEHTHHHRHADHEPESVRTEASVPGNVEPEDAITIPSVREDFLTVLPIIPDDMRAKQDEVYEDSTDMVSINETNQPPPVTTRQPMTTTSSAMVYSTSALTTTTTTTTSAMESVSGMTFPSWFNDTSKLRFCPWCAVNPELLHVSSGIRQKVVVFE